MMSAIMTYYFYDLETSGIDPKWQRIMQFAGIRTDENFNPIGEPHNILVTLTDEILPDPEAIMITGITPQKTLQEGITESAFLEIINKEVFVPNTVMLGFNSIRFDDEFMRYSLYRNYYDPYEREWKDNMSRWDILDLVRMTRALRPDGIEWPFDHNGEPTNRLELLAKANNISHESAHDALSDVQATISLAKLIAAKQPKLYNHLLEYRNKKKLATLIDAKNPQPFVHTSGMLSSEHQKTSVVIPIAPHPTNSNAVLVYDLRYSPDKWQELDSDEIRERAFMSRQERSKRQLDRLPIKAIHLNKSPAVAPLGVLDAASQERINLTLDQVNTHLAQLRNTEGFGERVFTAFEGSDHPEIDDVDGQLYGGFVNDNDKRIMQQVRNRNQDELSDWNPNFNDERMAQLLLKYKARNFPKSLSPEERSLWEQYRAKRLATNKHGLGFKGFFTRLQKIAEQDNLTPEKQFLIEELKLYAESLMPFENESLFDETGIE